MPHIIVKLYPGRTEHQKKELTTQIVNNVVKTLDCKDTAVSVSFEEIDSKEWPKKVYRPDISECPGKLYKKPGYDPFLIEEDKKENLTELKLYLQTALEVAQKEDTTGYFNAMSWLDLELEDNPESFDGFFDTSWEDLSQDDQAKRTRMIRCAL